MKQNRHAPKHQNAIQLRPAGDGGGNPDGRVAIRAEAISVQSANEAVFYVAVDEVAAVAEVAVLAGGVSRKRGPERIAANSLMPAKVRCMIFRQTISRFLSKLACAIRLHRRGVAVYQHG